MRILRAADYRSMPWKNGGGVTTEIAVSPEGAGLEDFDWRISMAKVASDGPFSLFPGIDRTLAVLEGEGIALDIAGRAPLTLGCGSDPLSFPADGATEARLVAGPITDLNVMTRRSRNDHHVRRFILEDPVEVEPAGAITLIFCRSGKIEVLGEALSPRDLLWLDPGEGAARLVPRQPSTAFLIRIHGARGPD
jgi:environmental stress-induced protein Ves